MRKGLYVRPEKLLCFFYLRPERERALATTVSTAVAIIAVGPHVDALEHPRVEGSLHVPRRRVRARHGRREVQQLPQPGPDVVLGQLPGKNVVPVGGCAVLEEEVDAVESGVAERPRRALLVAAQVGIPEVVRGQAPLAWTGASTRRRNPPPRGTPGRPCAGSA